MNKSREQYEEWFKKEFDSELVKHGGKLVNLVKREQFKVWQASRECLWVELPEPNPEDSGSPNFYDGYNTALIDICDELISNGVKVK